MFTKSLNKMDMRIDQISFPAILVLIAGLCYLYRLKIPHEHFGKTVYTSILEVAGLFYWEIVSVCWKLLRDWSVLLGVCVCKLRRLKNNPNFYDQGSFLRHNTLLPI